VRFAQRRGFEKNWKIPDIEKGEVNSRRSSATRLDGVGYKEGLENRFPACEEMNCERTQR
jgi:hypothetical protein